MAHPKRVINFALFFFALFNSANIARSNYPTGQFQTVQDKFGQPLPPVQI